MKVKGMRTCSFIAPASLLMTASVGSLVRAAETPAVAVEATVGGQAADLDQGRTAKFEEYRDVPQGAIFDSLLLRFGSESDPWRFEVRGTNMLREDQRYDLTLEGSGKLRAELYWDQTPHLFSNGATFLLREDPGRHTLDPGLRGIFEATADASLKPLVDQALATTAHDKEVLYRRDKAAGWFAWDVGAGFVLRLDLEREKRSGDRRVSAGTYIRGTGAGFDAEFFTPRGIEMPETIDYRNSSATLSASWGGKIGSARAGYTASRFENRVESLTWDNPFQVTPKRTLDWAGFSQADRGNFALSQLALSPDHTFDRWFLQGALNLPGRTRITGEYSASKTEQDEPFLPFTLNTAIFFPGPDGFLDDPTTLPVESADDIAAAGNITLMPQRSLDGEYKTKRASAAIATSFWAPLTLAGHWRSYEFEDDRPELELPGYAAFGDVAFRCGIGQAFGSQNRARPGFTACSGSGILFNELGGYTHDNYGADATWRIARPIILKVEGARDTWDYDRRQVEKTTEDILAASVSLMPWDWLTARLRWLEAERDFEGVYQVGLEASGIHAFDVWTRDRTRYGGDLDFAVGERWSIGVSYSNWEDEYPGTIEVDRDGTGAIPQADVAYGLTDATSDSVSVGATWSAAPSLSLYGSLGRDKSEWKSLSATKTALAGLTYDPNNRWTRVQDDRVDWLNLGLRLGLGKAVALVADYTFSEYEGEQRTKNPSLGDGNPGNDPTIASAIAVTLPDLGSDLRSGRTSVEWMVSPRLRLQFRYWHERYRLDDFSWDLVRPDMQGIVKELRGATLATATLTDANVNRYLFLDSRYSDYTANVWAAVLTYAF